MILLFSIDTPDGSGDHENYFLNANQAYESDGTRYSNCFKKALTIRSKTGIFNQTAVFNHQIRFMKGSDVFDTVIFPDGMPILRPDFS